MHLLLSELRDDLEAADLEESQNVIPKDFFVIFGVDDAENFIHQTSMTCFLLEVEVEDVGEELPCLIHSEEAFVRLVEMCEKVLDVFQSLSNLIFLVPFHSVFEVVKDDGEEDAQQEVDTD